MRIHRLFYPVFYALLVLFAGYSCGGGGGGGGAQCDATTQTGCSSGQVCENINTGGTGCFAPFTAQASVVDLTTGAALAGARYVLTDTAAADSFSATTGILSASDAEGNLAYSATGSNKLPANPTLGAAISGIWTGYLEAPENGFFNLRIEGDAGTTVALTVDGRTVTLAQNGAVWSNTAPIELRALRSVALPSRPSNLIARGLFASSGDTTQTMSQPRWHGGRGTTVDAVREQLPQVREHIGDYMAARLASGVSDRIKVHLAECPSCRKFMQEMQPQPMGDAASRSAPRFVFLDAGGRDSSAEPTDSGLDRRIAWASVR